MIFAVDPGPVKSAYVILGEDLRPEVADVLPNEEIEGAIVSFFGRTPFDKTPSDFVVERIACYGMPTGEDVLETVHWASRFLKTAEDWARNCERIRRMDVKMHLCHDSRAKDGSIIQALVDRFAPGQPNRGKGTAKKPGFFYGFHDDIWQAYAVGVTYADLQKSR